jgi:predicted NBD/HSP70 family sugar kinase
MRRVTGTDDAPPATATGAAGVGEAIEAGELAGTAGAGWAVTAAKPSLELLRGLSDEHVLRALLARDRMTRAELAAYTGISKPTVGESVRRLVEAGVLADTGERTTGRGRIGSYYALAAEVGCALAVSVAPEGVVAEVADARGRVLARASGAVTRPARSSQVASALRRVAEEAAGQAPSPVRLAMVSAADPVDRASGRTVQVPDAPFLLGELSPADALAGVVHGPVVVDNDVNWAARAERDAVGQAWTDVVYLYLGQGLGAAIISDGQVRRGSGGIVGEIAHMITVGPDGTAQRFLDVFGVLGLRHPASTAIDVDALTAAIVGAEAVGDGPVDGDGTVGGMVGGTGTGTGTVLAALVRAIGGVLTSVTALCDPELVVLGGPWGSRPGVVDAVRAAGVGLRRPVEIRAAVVTAHAPLAGARTAAVRALGDSIVDYRRTLAPAGNRVRNGAVPRRLAQRASGTP